MNGIANQATVTSDQLGPILSDDPEAPGAADPTRTAVVGTNPGGGGGGGGGVVSRPSIGTATPADGTIVTEPVTVTATIDPPAGFDIATWSIGYRPVGGTRGHHDRLGDRVRRPARRRRRNLRSDDPAQRPVSGHDPRRRVGWRRVRPPRRASSSTAT